MYSDMAGGYPYSMDIVEDIAKVVYDATGAGSIAGLGWRCETELP